MSPTPRAALLLGAIALATLVVPIGVAAIAFAIAVGAVVLDALAVRRPPEVERDVPRLLSRGVPGPLRLELETRPPGGARVRQPALPDVTVDPAESDRRLDALVVGRRRGRHVLPRPAVRLEGPLGLGCRHHRVGEDAEVLVYPDLVTAFRLAVAVRRGRFRDPGNLPRGPLGLGTEFESVRDYLPDDDVRQVNWRATARLGRPMSNQYRLERERDVVCVLDCGRLMAAPLGDLTRLDATVDAATAVAAVADEVGDRCGLIAFDGELRRRVPPARRNAKPLVRALFDLEPAPVESDYELGPHRPPGGVRREAARRGGADPRAAPRGGRRERRGHRPRGDDRRRAGEPARRLRGVGRARRARGPDPGRPAVTPRRSGRPRGLAGAAGGRLRRRLPAGEGVRPPLTGARGRRRAPSRARPGRSRRRSPPRGRRSRAWRGTPRRSQRRRARASSRGRSRSSSGPPR
ncbi:MAG: DUF58 domain-containing protein [Actinobacteria bacterium]|nr:MAG: DUF58 domain-containing protein [Actinomycetota bacterium]